MHIYYLHVIKPIDNDTLTDYLEMYKMHAK